MAAYNGETEGLVLVRKFADRVKGKNCEFTCATIP
jgi:hypothetical protein